MSDVGLTVDGQFVVDALATRARAGGVPHGELVGHEVSHAVVSGAAPVGVHNGLAFRLQRMGLIDVDPGSGIVSLMPAGLARAEGAPTDG